MHIKVSSGTSGAGARGCKGGGGGGRGLKHSDTLSKLQKQELKADAQLLEEELKSAGEAAGVCVLVYVYVCVCVCVCVCVNT